MIFNETWFSTNLLENKEIRPFSTLNKTEFLVSERIQGYKDFLIAINFVALSKRRMLRSTCKLEKQWLFLWLFALISCIASCGEITRISLPRHDSHTLKGLAHLEFKDIDGYRKTLF
ncbi:unnamed protein product [Vicia faba]|uniref:Uncharacterized protein n=1 Tax=Vicia faba TaxID=3906 RepID=A0AAV0YFE7_VICFA|nr:unnamed protein product [Vicia faba]